MNPTRDELIELRRQGLTREEIAAHYDVTIAAVRRWIRVMKIPRPASRRNASRSRTTAHGGLVAIPDDGFTTLELAQRELGGRLTERRGLGYYLDGKPARIDAILEAAGIEVK